MKKIYSLFALLLLAITSLSATAATIPVKFVLEPGSYAVLKFYDQSIGQNGAWSTIKTFTTGDNLVDLTEGLGYYVCAGGNHILVGAYPQGAGSTTCPIPNVKYDEKDLGSYAMIFAMTGQIAETYVIVTEGTDVPPGPGPDEPVIDGATDFVLEPGSAAYLRHWSMWGPDGKLLENLMTDLTFVTGNNPFLLEKDITYYITPAVGESFELVVDAEGNPQTINSPNDVVKNTQFVEIPAGTASSKYIIRTTNNQNRPIEKGTKFTLAPDSHASIYTAEGDNLKLVQELAEGDNWIELDIEANPYFIVPNPGYELARVETSDYKNIVLDVNTEFFPTNYVDINENLADAYYIVTRPAAGIETIEASANDAAQWFDLQGRRVERPSAGLYIRLMGGVASKVLVK